MVRIGRYRFGGAAVSMIVVFVVLSAGAVIAAFAQARPEWPMPLGDIIIVNEGMALIATLVYGILLHFAIAIADMIRNRKQQ